MRRGREVFLIEPLENRRRLAGDLGVKNVTAPQSLDTSLNITVAVETSGNPSSVDTMIKTAPPGSTIVLVGGDTTVPASVILAGELEVRASKGGRGLYPEAVALVASGSLSPGDLISHRFPVKDIAHAFEISSRQPDMVTRSVQDMAVW